jgi:hypothetical protein
LAARLQWTGRREEGDGDEGIEEKKKYLWVPRDFDRWGSPSLLEI